MCDSLNIQCFFFLIKKKKKMVLVCILTYVTIYQTFVLFPVDHTPESGVHIFVFIASDAIIIDIRYWCILGRVPCLKFIYTSYYCLPLRSFEGYGYNIYFSCICCLSFWFSHFWFVYHSSWENCKYLFGKIYFRPPQFFFIIASNVFLRHFQETSGHCSVHNKPASVL